MTPTDLGDCEARLCFDTGKRSGHTRWIRCANAATQAVPLTDDRGEERRVLLCDGHAHSLGLGT